MDIVFASSLAVSVGAQPQVDEFGILMLRVFAIFVVMWFVARSVIGPRGSS